MKILTSEAQCHNLDQLQRELRKHIEGKKYLLVLDDVWDDNPSNWDRLGTLLNCGAIGSKILITTRKTKVAQCLDAIEPYYRLNVLSKESAWSLFVKIAFKDGEFDSDSELVSVGKQILLKCGYVPLALTTIGRILPYRKKDKKEWLSFVEKELEYVLLDDDEDGKVMQVLKVSYNDLPLALRRCFAYCSVFPKDHVFEKNVLVCMWLAQGFVEPYAKKSLEEVGDDYFFHLVDRCLFQEVKRLERGFGIVKYACKMHDLLHDFAIQVAGLEFKCFEEEEELRDMVKTNVIGHISVICSPNCSPAYSNLSSHSNTLRTLRFIDAKHLELNSLSLVLERFKMLRTLDLSWLNFEKLPDSFEGLIHLRYLDLTENSRLTALPNSICKLHHLQTLTLMGCRELKELPSNLGKLVSLRHLCLKFCSDLHSFPSGFSKLTTLAGLDRFIVHHSSGALRYLGRLDDLCGTIKIELPMHGWTNCIEDAKKSNRTNKCKLSGMIIKWIRGDEEGDMAKEEKKAILEELQPHAYLQYLKIDKYMSDRLPSWFSSLSNVKELSLKHCSVEYLDVSVRSGYLLPCLESLELNNLPQLKGWWREAATSPRDNDAMSAAQTLPRVSKLVITRCGSLVENMPLFREIEELDLYKVNVKLLKMLLRVPNTQCVSEFHCFTKLKVMDLFEMQDMECFPEDWIKLLTALKTLRIHYCKKLSWVSSRGLAYLTSLEELKIMGQESVRIEDKDDEKPVARININNELGLTPWKALSKLRKLAMHWQSHFQEGLQYLTSLQELRMFYDEAQQVEMDNAQDLKGRALRWQGLERLQTICLRFKKMTCLFPKWILYLPFLQKLTLDDCGEMNFDDWAAEQTQFSSLVELDIHSYNEQRYYAGIKLVTWKLLPSLRTLEIDCGSSKIPDGIQHLTSLRLLIIMKCSRLYEIPKWMINLTSLQLLILDGCSTEFKERCKPETGADWPLISHIPNTQIEVDI